MFGNKQCDVLVAGAGPAGMTLALALARLGVSVGIVDEEEQACAASHALLLHPSTLSLLERLDLLPEILSRSRRIPRALLHDEAEAKAEARFDQGSEDHPFAATLPQYELEGILEQALRESGVPVGWNQRVSEVQLASGGFVAFADRLADRQTGYAVAHQDRIIDKTLRYACRCLVGADGFNSLLRRLLDAGAPETTGPGQAVAAFDIETGPDAPDELRVGLVDNLLAAQFPLPNGMARLAFEIAELDLADDYRAKSRSFAFERESADKLLGDKALGRLLETRMPWNSGYAGHIAWRAAAPFPQRAVPRMRNGHAFLLGDAARSFLPIGHAGLNSGMHEAAELAEQIRAGFDANLLDSRFGSLAEELVARHRGIHRIAQACKPAGEADPWIARHCDKLLPCLPATGTELQSLASQLGVRLAAPEATSSQQS